MTNSEKFRNRINVKGNTYTILTDLTTNKPSTSTQNNEQLGKNGNAGLSNELLKTMSYKKTVRRSHWQAHLASREQFSSTTPPYFFLEPALPKHLVENVHRLPQIPAISSPCQLHGVVLCCLRLDLQTGGFPSSVSSSLLWVLFCVGSSCATVLGFSGRQTTQFVL
ncbi:hypothetical protein CEXT_170201 [Caerostris extrusa]|uniref:Uncharacterized protein n=1 Tax=Caerostris extrusa TaxID=172846 RepID=A0AAV4YDZ2_CAEEX|nr:hypothetical protein CEXT_170201 [Caerostris extrusa]